MSGQRISTMTELADINAGDYIEVSEDAGGGLYTTKKYDVGKVAQKLILETAEKTADYTLALADADKVVLMNKTGAATLTVPTNASVEFPIGTIIGVYNTSSDAVTIAGDGGVAVRNAGSLAQYGEVSLRKRGVDEWVLAGAVS